MVVSRCIGVFVGAYGGVTRCIWVCVGACGCI
jgi:hypothetical protein